MRVRPSLFEVVVFFGMAALCVGSMVVADLLAYHGYPHKDWVATGWVFFAGAVVWSAIAALRIVAEEEA
jgi:hypothetical protein